MILQPKRKKRKIEENQPEFIVVGLPPEENVPEIIKRKVDKTDEQDGQPNVKKRRKNDFTKLTKEDEHPVQNTTVRNEDPVDFVKIIEIYRSN